LLYFLDLLIVCQRETTLGRFHQHLRQKFLSEQDEKLFLSNGEWQTAHRFGKQHTDLATGTPIFKNVSLQI
jgi:hypothetical protein